MKYPFPTGISAPCFNKKEDTEEQFKNLLTTAVMLESLYPFYMQNDSKRVASKGFFR